MRKINIKPYKVQALDRDKDNRLVPRTVDYTMKASMEGMLFHPDLKLDGREVLRRDRIAEKIEKCTKDVILLEEDEWLKLKNAVETLKGFGRHDVEFVRRILTAEKVEVKEKKKK